jgi:hypothetical protein
MHNVNCWLLALAFLLGLVITLAFLLRRVKREVPEYGSGSGAARLTGSSPGVKAPKVDAPDVDAPTAKVPKISGGDVDTPTAKVPKVDAPDVDAPTAVVPKVDGPKVSGGGAVAAGAAGVAGGAAAAKLVGSGGDVDTPTAKVPKVDAPKVSGGGAVAAGAAGVAGGAAAAKLVGSGGDSGKDSEPYGAGSLRLAAGAAAPSGWTIKGNEDSMLYHTTESPSYKRTIAEVWFFDEDTARNAGFTHWKEGRKAGGAANFAATEPEVPPGKFGPGSTTPAADGSGPAGWTVKGNEDSMLYHSPESPAYAVTVAEIWFRDVPTAEAAGFNRWDSGKSQRDK